MEQEKFEQAKIVERQIQLSNVFTNILNSVAPNGQVTAGATLTCVIPVDGKEANKGFIEFTQEDIGFIKSLIDCAAKYNKEQKKKFEEI